jgi:hypothetical protein
LRNQQYSLAIKDENKLKHLEVYLEEVNQNNQKIDFIASHNVELNNPPESFQYDLVGVLNYDYTDKLKSKNAKLKVVFKLFDEAGNFKSQSAYLYLDNQAPEFVDLKITTTNIGLKSIEDKLLLEITAKDNFLTTLNATIFIKKDLEAKIAELTLPFVNNECKASYQFELSDFLGHQGLQDLRVVLSDGQNTAEKIMPLYVDVTPPELNPISTPNSVVNLEKLRELSQKFVFGLNDNLAANLKFQVLAVGSFSVLQTKGLQYRGIKSKGGLLRKSSAAPPQEQAVCLVDTSYNPGQINFYLTEADFGKVEGRLNLKFIANDGLNDTELIYPMTFDYTAPEVKNLQFVTPNIGLKSLENKEVKLNFDVFDNLADSTQLKVKLRLLNLEKIKNFGEFTPVSNNFTYEFKKEDFLDFEGQNDLIAAISDGANIKEMRLPIWVDLTPPVITEFAAPTGSIGINDFFNFKSKIKWAATDNLKKELKIQLFSLRNQEKVLIYETIKPGGSGFLDLHKEDFVDLEGDQDLLFVVSDGVNETSLTQHVLIDLSLPEIENLVVSPNRIGLVQINDAKVECTLADNLAQNLQVRVYLQKLDQERLLTHQNTVVASGSEAIPFAENGGLLIKARNDNRVVRQDRSQEIGIASQARNDNFSESRGIASKGYANDNRVVRQDRSQEIGIASQARNDNFSESRGIASKGYANDNAKAKFSYQFKSSDFKDFEGPLTLKIVCSDGVNEASVTSNIYVDLTPPQIKEFLADKEIGLSKIIKKDSLVSFEVQDNLAPTLNLSLVSIMQNKEKILYQQKEPGSFKSLVFLERDFKDWQGKQTFVLKASDGLNETTQSLETYIDIDPPQITDFLVVSTGNINIKALENGLLVKMKAKDNLGKELSLSKASTESGPGLRLKLLLKPKAEKIAVASKKKTYFFGLGILNLNQETTTENQNERQIFDEATEYKIKEAEYRLINTDFITPTGDYILKFVVTDGINEVYKEEELKIDLEKPSLVSKTVRTNYLSSKSKAEEVLSLDFSETIKKSAIWLLDKNSKQVIFAANFMPIFTLGQIQTATPSQNLVGELWSYQLLASSLKSMPEGSYQLYVAYKDNFDNEGDALSETIFIDNTPPTLKTNLDNLIIGVPKNQSANELVFKISSIKSTDLYFNPELNFETQDNLCPSVNLSIDWLYFGESIATEKNYQVLRGSKRLLKANKGFKAAKFRVNKKAKLRTNEVVGADALALTDLINNPEIAGPVEYQLVLTDNAENFVTYNGRIIIDRALPTINIEDSIPKFLNSDSLVVSFNAADAETKITSTEFSLLNSELQVIFSDPVETGRDLSGSGVETGPVGTGRVGGSVKTGPVETGRGLYLRNYAEGEYRIKVTAKDQGNHVGAAEKVFTIDKTAPEIVSLTTNKAVFFTKDQEKLTYQLEVKDNFVNNLTFKIPELDYEITIDAAATQNVAVQSVRSLGTGLKINNDIPPFRGDKGGPHGDKGNFATTKMGPHGDKGELRGLQTRSVGNNRDYFLRKTNATSRIFGLNEVTKIEAGTAGSKIIKGEIDLSALNKTESLTTQALTFVVQDEAGNQNVVTKNITLIGAVPEPKIVLESNQVSYLKPLKVNLDLTPVFDLGFKAVSCKIELVQKSDLAASENYFSKLTILDEQFKSNALKEKILSINLDKNLGNSKLYTLKVSLGLPNSEASDTDFQERFSKVLPEFTSFKDAGFIEILNSAPDLGTINLAGNGYFQVAEIGFTGSAKPMFNEPLTWQYQVFDVAGSLLNEGALANLNSKINLSELNQGEFLLDLTCNSNYGLTSKKRFSFVLDKTKAQIILSKETFYIKSYDQKEVEIPWEIKDLLNGKNLGINEIQHKIYDKNHLYLGTELIDKTKITQDKFTWNGKLIDGTELENGLYEIEISVYDLAGNVATKNFFVQYEKEVPKLAIKADFTAVNPELTTPNVRLALGQDFEKVSFKLVKDASFETVEVFQTDAKSLKGETSFTLNLKGLKDGAYLLMAAGKPFDDSQEVSTKYLFNIRTVLPKVEPKFNTLYLHNLTQPILISNFAAFEPWWGLKISVLNEKNQEVYVQYEKELYAQFDQEKALKIKALPENVVDGPYFLRIRTFDDAGNEFQVQEPIVFHKVLQADLTLRTLLGQGFAPDAVHFFTPNSDGILDDFGFNLCPSGSAGVYQAEVNVQKTNGEFVTTLFKGEVKHAQTQKITWPQTLAKIQAEDKYLIQVKLSSIYGEILDVKEFPVFLIKQKPELVNYVSKTYLISPNNDNKSDQVDLAYQAKISELILNQNALDKNLNLKIYLKEDTSFNKLVLDTKLEPESARKFEINKSVLEELLTTSSVKDHDLSVIVVLTDSYETMTTSNLEKVRVDVTVPAKPELILLGNNITNKSEVALKFKLEPDSKFYLFSNQILVKEAIVPESQLVDLTLGLGSYFVTANLTVPTNKFTLQTEDAAGNLSELSTDLAVIYDTKAPEISEVIKSNPELGLNLPWSVQVKFNKDLDQTVLPKAALNLGLDENGQTQIVLGKTRFVNSRELAVDFIVMIPSVNAEKEIVISKIQDLAGNVTTQNFALQIDTIVPNAPQVNLAHPTTNQDYGEITLGKEPQSELEVKINNQILKYTQDLPSIKDQVSVGITDLPLVMGQNLVEVRQIDLAKNASEFSGQQIITLERDAQGL